MCVLKSTSGIHVRDHNLSRGREEEEHSLVSYFILIY